MSLDTRTPALLVTVALGIAVAKRHVTSAKLAELDTLLDRIRAMLYRLSR